MHSVAVLSGFAAVLIAAHFIEKALDRRLKREHAKLTALRARVHLVGDGVTDNTAALQAMLDGVARAQEVDELERLWEAPAYQR